MKPNNKILISKKTKPEHHKTISHSPGLGEAGSSGAKRRHASKQHKATGRAAGHELKSLEDESPYSGNHRSDAR